MVLNIWWIPNIYVDVQKFMFGDFGCSGWFQIEYAFQALPKVSTGCLPGIKQPEPLPAPLGATTARWPLLDEFSW